MTNRVSAAQVSRVLGQGGHLRHQPRSRFEAGVAGFRVNQVSPFLVVVNDFPRTEMGNLETYAETLRAAGYRAPVDVGLGVSNARLLVRWPEVSDA